MNLYLSTYFMILIWIRTIYSQFFVNFRILGKNGDDWAKGENTKLKWGSLNAPTLTKARPNSSKQDATRGSHPGKITQVMLGPFSYNSPKRAQ